MEALTMYLNDDLPKIQDALNAETEEREIMEMAIIKQFN